MPIAAHKIQAGINESAGIAAIPPTRTFLTLPRQPQIRVQSMLHLLQYSFWYDILLSSALNPVSALAASHLTTPRHFRGFWLGKERFGRWAFGTQEQGRPGILVAKGWAVWDFRAAHSQDGQQGALVRLSSPVAVNTSWASGLAFAPSWLPRGTEALPSSAGAAPHQPLQPRPHRHGAETEKLPRPGSLSSLLVVPALSSDNLASHLPRTFG